MNYMDTDGARIHYEDTGDGFPILLIHAGIVNLGMWDEQISALTEKYRVIRYDVRGWGKSLEEEGDYSDHDDASDLLSYLGLEQAVIVGVSFGGSIALDLALAHPEKVRALVLVGSALGGYEFTSKDFESDDKAMDAAYNKGDKALAAEYAARIWVDGHGRTKDVVSASFRNKALEMILHTFELPDGDGDRQDLEPAAVTQLDKIDQPVLIVLGEYDQPVIFDINRLLRESIKESELVTIDNAAHLPNMEQPEEFNRLILDFLGVHTTG